MNANKIYPWYFNISALFLYVILFFVPSVIGLFYSFTDWNGYSDIVKFVGLKNFHDIFFSNNSMYLAFITNTLKFTFFSIIIKTFLSFALALLLTTGVRMTNLHRMIAFSPQVLSFMIIGLIFKGILHPTTGLLNITLRSVGLGAIATDWLGNARTALASIIGVDAWKGVGFGMVIFIAGIQTIPYTYYESADIDGASYIQKTFRITIPFLVPTIVMNIIFHLIYGLRVFDIIYVLTNGGPGYATDTINTAVLRQFGTGNYAMGTALSSILALFTVLISYFIIKGLDRKVEY